jgi:RimJ/RimL family protein N-acetyltransferase
VLPLALETPRLILRALTEADFPFLVALHADERVARFLGTGRPRSEAETRDWFDKTQRWYRDERAGHLGVTLRQEPERLIGRCGLSWFEVEIMNGTPRAFWGRGSAPAGVAVTPILELGYTFAPTAWGNGFATEASRALRDAAFEAGVPRLMSVIHAQNVSSRRVAEKNGFVEHGELDVFGRKFGRHELSHDEWMSLKGAAR